MLQGSPWPSGSGSDSMRPPQILQNRTNCTVPCLPGHCLLFSQRSDCVPLHFQLVPTCWGQPCDAEVRLGAWGRGPPRLTPARRETRGGGNSRTGGLHEARWKLHAARLRRHPAGVGKIMRRKKQVFFWKGLNSASSGLCWSRGKTEGVWSLRSLTVTVQALFTCHVKKCHGCVPRRLPYGH